MSEQLDFDEFARRYCERQENDPESLLTTLQIQRNKFKPTGWMLLECQQLDSSRAGSYTILPYGPNNTFKEVPDHPVSPRGSAADQSMAVAILLSEDLP